MTRQYIVTTESGQRLTIGFTLRTATAARNWANDINSRDLPTAEKAVPVRLDKHGKRHPIVW